MSDEYTQDICVNPFGEREVDILKDIKNADKRFLQLSSRGKHIKQLEDQLHKITLLAYADHNDEIIKILEQK